MIDNPLTIAGSPTTRSRVGDRRKARAGTCFLAFLLVTTFGGCRSGNEYPARPITLVCPWAAGGGTDRVSRQVALLLEQELGQPVSVINATGGKGVTGHNRGLRARPDGYTVTMMTSELNTMHWAGLTDLSYRDCVPLALLNADYAALFVRNDAGWRTIEEIEADIRATPKTLTASGTAVGGAWHLALAGWLYAAGIDSGDVVWVPSQGANPSLQQLISGGVDMVCCSLPEARALLEGGEIRALGLMGPEPAKGFENVRTFAEQGRDWVNGGWRGIGVPLGTPPDVVDRLVEALNKIATEEPREGNFADFMEKQKFGVTYADPEEFGEFLATTDEMFGKLLSSDAMRSINEDRFSPMAYPYTLMGLIGLTLVALCVVTIRLRQPNSAEPTQDAVPDEVADGGVTSAFLVIVAVVAYVMLAETLGFLLVAGMIVLALLLKLGNRVGISVLVTVLLVPMIYFVFAFVLRVPLPSGLLG